MSEDTPDFRPPTESGSTARRPSGDVNHGSTSAEELRRIVEVAEELKIDPQIARIALEAGDGSVSTDFGPSRSVAEAERALNRGAAGQTSVSVASMHGNAPGSYQLPSTSDRRR